MILPPEPLVGPRETRYPSAGRLAWLNHVSVGDQVRLAKTVSESDICCLTNQQGHTVAVAEHTLPCWQRC